jgi:hypothetical protein
VARRQQLGNFASTIAKIRKAVHKIFPRELSPTRMAEKYASDAKKKGAKKLAAVSIESDARNKAGDELLQRQMATLQAAIPGLAPGAVPSGLLPFGPIDNLPAPTAPAVPARNLTPWIVGGGLLAVIAIAAGRRR